MSLIILSALGTGNYREANYKSEYHAGVIRTGLFAVALHQWYPEAQVKLLATEKARGSENGDFVRQNHPNFEFVPIPESRTEAEAWELFQVIADHIPEGSRVIFDVTHSLRSLPMLGFLVLSYLRVVKKVTIERVFYGALDLTPREEGALTPVIDLTPFVSLLDWAQAANRFQDTGDASLFKELLEMKRQASYNAVSRQLATLSQAIFSNRGLEVPDEAAKLLRVLEQAREGQLESHQRPFALVMQRLTQQVAPLAAAGDDKLGLEAKYALICWYAERGHYPQALSLAREWLISVRQWHQLGRVSMDETERESVNKDVWHAINQLQGGSDTEDSEADVPNYPGLDARLHAYAYATNQVAKRRNDFMHFGFKTEAMTVKKVGPRSQRALALLPAAVRPLGLELEPPKGNIQ